MSTGTNPTPAASHTDDATHHVHAAFADLDRGLDDLVGEVKKLHAMHTAALEKQYTDFMAGARKDMAHKQGGGGDAGGHDEHTKGVERAADAYRAKLQKYKRELAERWGHHGGGGAGGGAGVGAGGGGATGGTTTAAA